MSENFNYLFQYLEKENITINKSEFDFQIQTHPDFPAILSVVDTLSFFNIKNGVIQVDFENITDLPDHFIALLNIDNNQQKLFFIEKEGDDYIYKKEGKIIEKLKVTPEIWSRIVHLVEKSEIETLSVTHKSDFNWVLPILSLIFFLLYLSYSSIDLWSKLFFVFPITGILFSVAALKDLFGAKLGLLNSFCNLTSSTSCSEVVNSNKWKIFQIVNFSDLSVIFFTTQLVGFFALLLAGDMVTYFFLQQVLLLGTIPFLLLSIYFQKNVEKKWCPICLVIMSIILLELIYLFLFQKNDFFFSPASIAVFVLIGLVVTAVWTILKKVLTKQKELKEYQLKAIRFERNYDIFRNSLLAKQNNELPQSPIVFGNKNSETKIVLISNPFCSYCKEAHIVIESILEKYSNDVQVQLILKTNLERENEAAKKMFRSLISIYINKGEIPFITALKTWFENNNLTEWLERFSVNVTEEFDPIFHSHYKWCEENDFNFTPAIFINGYEYPQMYNRKTLPFFIQDIIEDEF